MMPNIDAAPISIDVSLVHRLVSLQFPQWKDLPIKAVEFSGWDNRTFHLGEEMVVRMPSREDYAGQVEKEQLWLPKLAPYLPLPIAMPVAMGQPGEGYPWLWSIYRWLEGETASREGILDLNKFATDLGTFLVALQKCDATGGPIAGPHNFYRGGSLVTYDAETRQALSVLKDIVDVVAITEIWDQALTSTWQLAPVWVHGDIAPGNLLIQHYRLSAVIDFGCLGIGDPACDLVIAWTFFKGDSRKAFKAAVPLDADTWVRARAWALWKALIVYAGLPGTNPFEKENARRVINEVLGDSNIEWQQE